MRITSKGQVTIPQAMREQAGLMPGAEVEFSLEGKTVRIARVRKPEGATRGERIVARLRGAGDVRMSTDEIMALTRGPGGKQNRKR
jgi:AbrB family looped-hinge helix DNA binding protein